MCTSIIEIARAEGMAKRGDEWFPLTQSVVAYDHARHANLGDVITLDFINAALEPGARAGVELTLESAKELRAALDRAIAAAEFEEAEVRGKGARRASFGRRKRSETQKNHDPQFTAPDRRGHQEPKRIRFTFVSNGTLPYLDSPFHSYRGRPQKAGFRAWIDARPRGPVFGL